VPESIFDYRSAGQPATAMAGSSRHPVLPRENKVPWKKLKHLVLRIDGWNTLAGCRLN